MKIRYGRRNIRLGKRLSGEMSRRGSLRRASVRSGKWPVGELSGRGSGRRGIVRRGDVSQGSILGDVSVGELSSRETVLQTIMVFILLLFKSLVILEGCS